MPYLKLKIVSGSEVGQNDNYSFTHLGGSIGRSEDCEWTLLDSDRFVSKKHLAISYRNQQFILTDISSNGVIINSAAAPLGRGNEHKLQTHDSLVIGKHVVKVEEVNVDIEDINPFQTPSSSSDGDLLGLVLGTNTASEPMHGTMPAPQALFNAPESLDLFPATKPESELGLEGILTGSVESPAAKEFSNFNDQSNPFNISEPATPAVNVPSPSDTINTHVKADDSLIPDDWDMFDTKPAAANVELPIEPTSSMTAGHTDANVATTEHDHILVTSEVPKKPADFLSDDNASIFAAPPLETSKSNDIQSIQSTQPLVTPAPQTVRQETHQENSDIAPQTGITDAPKNTPNDDFFTSLYDKLGLSKEFKATINQQDFAADIATILLSTTQGLMSLLASRTAFKQESRLSSTLIQPRSNNPIKFSIDPVDTLEMLLVKKKKGYMSVGDSYDEAMEDIQLHQMAFMSGLQGTFGWGLSTIGP